MNSWILSPDGQSDIAGIENGLAVGGLPLHPSIPLSGLPTYFYLKVVKKTGTIILGNLVGCDVAYLLRPGNEDMRQT